MQSGYNGGVEAQFGSLVFGDGQQTVSGQEPWLGPGLYAGLYAGLDYDAETATDHAQFRQYGATQGRWMMPDPYSGSYDLTNPQSMNRYVYALNNPLAFVDPSGLDACQFSERFVSGANIGTDITTVCVIADPSGGGTSYWGPGDTIGYNPPGYEPNSGLWSGGGQGNGTSNSPNYSMADVCAASALLNKGAGTFLDALGIIPGEGNLLAVIQAGAGLISAGMAVSGGSPTDFAFSGGGLGLTAASLTYSKTAVQTLRTTTIAGSKMIPIVGNILSIGATANDIWGKEGMVNYYNDCMAGKN